MRRGFALAPVALVLFALFMAPAARTIPGPPPVAASRGAKTVEPTLPLILALRVTGQQGGARGGVALLEVSLDALAGVREATLSLMMPDGVKADDGPLARPLKTSFRSGENRRYVVPLTASRAGQYPLRLRASFRLDDGREFETEQGVALRLGVPAPAGRSIAGAYEFMAVPQADLAR